MSFPTTSVLDSFNRANAGPPPSASWTTIVDQTGSGIKIVSDKGVGAYSGGDNIAGYNVAKYGPASEAYVTVAALGGTGYGVNLFVRCSNLTTPVGATTGYMLSGYTGNIQLFKMASWGSFTQIGSTSTQAISAGDSIGISAIGTTITAYYKAAAGSWTSIITVTDSTYSASGYLWLDCDYEGGTSPGVTNFGGGTQVSAANFLKEQYWWNNDQTTGTNIYTKGYQQRPSGLYVPDYRR